MSRYDFLLVGAGLFSSVIAERASRKGKTCLRLKNDDDFFYDYLK